MNSGVVNGQLGFARASDVVADTERKGLLRAKSPAPYEQAAEHVEHIEIHHCPAVDWSATTAPKPDLKTMGFDCIDLSGRAELQSVLEETRRAGRLTRENARVIRANMRGRSFRTSGGRWLKILFIASEGVILRRAGPNGLDVDPAETVSDMNGHRGATMVHGDQDVYGTPLRQMMKGAAPWLFRHSTPDGANRLSPVFLLNVWIPLEQITQPLALVDRRTVALRKQQLRYALPTNAFLEREEEIQQNDIWLFLHDERQQWFFHSDLNADSAYVFDTLGEAHGAMTLPGEDVAERYYQCLRQACEAVDRHEETTLRSATDIGELPLPPDTTRPLRAAITNMRALISEAHDSSPTALAQGDWRERVTEAMDRMVRKSIEMRAVALVL